MAETDSGLKRLVMSLARRIEERHVDSYGAVDKKGIHADTLDEFEEE